MTKVLIKKQLNELFRGYFVNAKTGKLRSKSGIAMYFLLFGCVLFSIGMAFYSMASFLADGLMGAGLDWLYFSILGLMSATLGIIGSVFNTYTGIYHAKDNELLLSMPIKPSQILISRIVSVYILSLVYEAPIFVSAMVAAFSVKTPGPIDVLIPVLSLVSLAFFVSAITCILGWVVASVSGKLKNKNIITVILSLVLIGGYYFLTSKMGTYLTMVVNNAESVGAKIKAFIFPFYVLGKGCAGSIPYFLAFLGVSVAAFVVVCSVLSINFIKITTSSAKTVKYKIKKQSAKSVNKALLTKELKRFLASPTYMLNCGLGLVMLLAASVLLIVKKDYVSSVLANIEGFEFMIPVLAMAAVFLMCGTSDISAPSISLEGKNIWILKSLPVETEDILKAKAGLHILLNILPTLVFTVACGYVLKIQMVTIVLLVLAACIYVPFTAIVGIMLNLKFPNLTWTNETMPIKQSMPVFLCLFGGWGISAAVGGLYYLLNAYLSPVVYIGIVVAVLAVLTFILYRLMVTKGKQMFEEL